MLLGGDYMNCGCNNNYNTLPPIVTRQTNVVHRYYVTDQPYIIENETKYVNHYVKRNYFIPRNICSEENTYSEQNCGNSCGCGNNWSGNRF